jgi:hypothetical protein
MPRWFHPLRLALALSVGFGTAALADGNSAPMLGWHRSGSNYPYYSIWNGSSWTAAQGARSIGDEAVWLVLRNCPTRPEYVMGTLDWVRDVNVQFHTSGTWGGLTEICTDAGGWDTRAFDLVYEQTSGDLLIVYWNNTGAGSLCYRTYSGSGLSSPSALTLPNGSRIKWVKLVPKANSNEIMLLALNGPVTLFAARWNGSAFGGVTQPHNNCSYSSCECFDGVYESQPGDALAVYSPFSTRSGLWGRRKRGLITSSFFAPPQSKHGLYRSLTLRTGPPSTRAPWSRASDSPRSRCAGQLCIAYLTIRQDDGGACAPLSMFFVRPKEERK